MYGMYVTSPCGLLRNLKIGCTISRLAALSQDWLHYLEIGENAQCNQIPRLHGINTLTTTTEMYSVWTSHVDWGKGTLVLPFMTNGYSIHVYIVHIPSILCNCHNSVVYQDTMSSIIPI